MDKYLFSYATASDPPIQRALIRLVEKATGQPKLKRMYVENQRFPREGETFWQAAVRSLELDVRYDPHALSAVPKTGPVVFVANHPYGVLDGIVMGWLVSNARPDFLVLTHIVLTRAPEAAPSSCQSIFPAPRAPSRRTWRPAPQRAPISQRAALSLCSRPAPFRRRRTSLVRGPQSMGAGSPSSRSSSSVRRPVWCRSGSAARTAAFFRSRVM
jgi:hypothetical protein